MILTEFWVRIMKQNSLQMICVTNLLTITKIASDRVNKNSTIDYLIISAEINFFKLLTWKIWRYCLNGAF